jgi:hypothetical protein
MHVCDSLVGVLFFRVQGTTGSDPNCIAKRPSIIYSAQLGFSVKQLRNILITSRNRKPLRKLIAVTIRGFELKTLLSSPILFKQSVLLYHLLPRRSLTSVEPTLSVEVVYDIFIGTITRLWFIY